MRTFSQWLLMLLCLSLLSLPLRAASQEPCKVEIEVVSSEDGVPLSGALCHLVDRSDKLVEYGVTDSRGRVTLSLSDRVARLQVALMSYRRSVISRERLECDGHIRVELVPTATELPEVSVKSPPVVAYKDTVSYSVGAFRVKSDKSIGDVLRKMPGVEVSKSGGLRYQGRPIKHLYIEGQDLLEHRYNLATQNLPADAVSDVEVLERHTHERILKDRSGSEEVAMNLKLQEGYKGRPFGEMTLAAGGRPLLLGAKGSATLVRRRSQTMLSLSGNNLGDDPIVLYGGLSLSTAPSQQMPLASTLLETSMGTHLPLPVERYLDNRSGAFDLSHLIISGPTSSLRLGMAGITDRRQMAEEHRRHYGGSQPLDYSEQRMGLRRYLWLSPSCTYELNSDRLFLSNKLSAEMRRESLGTELHTGGQGDPSLVSQDGGVRRYDVVNSLRTIVGVGDGLLLRGHLLSGYRDMTERLGVSLQGMDHLYRHRQVVMRGSLATTKAIGSRFLLYLSAHGDGDLSSFAVDGGAPMSYRLGSISLSPELLYRSPGNELVVSLGLPLGLSAYGTEGVTRSLPTVTPELRVTLAPSRRTTFRLSALRDDALLPPTFLSLSPLRTDYRSRIAYPIDPTREEEWRITLSGEYRNLLYMIFANGTLMWQRRRGDHIRSLEIEGDQLLYSYLPGTAQSDRLYGGLSLTKSFVESGTLIKGQIDLSHFRTPLLQGLERYLVPLTYLSTQLRLEQKLWSWGNLLYGLSVGQSMRHGEGRVDRLGSLTHQGKIYLFPHEQWSLSLGYEGGRSEMARGQYAHYHFLDASVEYSISSKWEIRLSGRNLLDSSTYHQTFYNGINDFADVSRLRPRELLLSTKYSF